MTQKDNIIDSIGLLGAISMSKAHIANRYLRACIAGAERQGHSAEELLQAADIPIEWLDQPQHLISEAQITRLIKFVWRATQDEFLGLNPQACRQGSFALMTEFCLSSVTIGAMLKRSAQVYRVVHDGMDIALEEQPTDGGLVFFRLHMRDQRLDQHHLLQEFVLLMWQRFICWLVGQQVPIATTCFSYPEPDHFDEYQLIYASECRFSQPICGFYLHNRYLQLPIIRTESELNVFLKESPAYILHRPSRDDSLRTQVRFLLSRYDYTNIPGLEVIAGELHLTPRSVRRKLKEEGETFSGIKAAIRRDYAFKLLITENLSISEISARVGFSEMAAFCRAFLRWTGKSPSAWRREHK